MKNRKRQINGQRKRRGSEEMVGDSKNTSNLRMSMRELGRLEEDPDP